jgi:hypothetical protein
MVLILRMHYDNGCRRVQCVPWPGPIGGLITSRTSTKQKVTSFHFDLLRLVLEFVIKRLRIKLKWLPVPYPLQNIASDKAVVLMTGYEIGNVHILHARYRHGSCSTHLDDTKERRVSNGGKDTKIAFGRTRLESTELLDLKH